MEGRREELEQHPELCEPLHAAELSFTSREKHRSWCCPERLFPKNAQFQGSRERQREAM